MGTLLLAAATNPTTTDPSAPWWGKVLVGFVLIALGVVLGLAGLKRREGIGDLIGIYYIWAVLGLIAIGVAVVLWGLGAIDSIGM